MSDEKDKKTEEQENKGTKKQDDKGEKKEENKTEEVKEDKKEEKKEDKKVPTPRQDVGGTGSRPESVGKEKKQDKPAPSGKFKDLIKQIEELSVMELAELVKDLEERFGVSAAAPIAVAAIGSTTGGEKEKKEEKSAYTIHLVDAGSQKIAVIKAIREIRQDLGLKEAKDLVDGAPKEVKTDVPKAEAEEAKKKLEAAGAKIELK